MIPRCWYICCSRQSVHEDLHPLHTDGRHNIPTRSTYPCYVFDLGYWSSDVQIYQKRSVVNAFSICSVLPFCCSIFCEKRNSVGLNGCKDTNIFRKWLSEKEFLFFFVYLWYYLYGICLEIQDKKYNHYFAKKGKLKFTLSLEKCFSQMKA